MHGRAVVQVTVEHSEEREDPPTTPHQGVLPPAMSKQFFRCALTAKAICTGPLANLEPPTVEQLAEAIAATIGQRINTPPELQHAQWLTDTMIAAGVEMQQHHTEPALLCVGDDNLCAISLGKDDEEFADTLRGLAMALTSHVALLRAVRLRTIVIYLTESEFDPSEILVHPFSQTLTAHHHSIIGGTCRTDRAEQGCKTVSTACGKIKVAPVEAEDEDELELNYEENDSTMDVDTAQRGVAEAPGKGKAAASAKHKKKQPRGRSHSCGTTRNRSRSKPRLCGTHNSGSDWETDDEAAQAF
eukprot:jgi/Tetstr1/429710/TSEL_019605.t1